MLTVVEEISPAANTVKHTAFPRAYEALPDSLVPVARCAAAYVASHSTSVPAHTTAAAFHHTCDAIVVLYSRHLIADAQVCVAVQFECGTAGYLRFGPIEKYCMVFVAFERMHSALSHGPKP